MPPKRLCFTQGARQFLVFELAKSRLAFALEYFGDGVTGGIRNASIEVHVQPANLPGKQTSDRGFPSAHKSSKAKKCAGAIVLRCGQRMVAVSVQSNAALLAPVDVDCTIERFQLDFGLALVVNAEETLREAGNGTLARRCRREVRVVLHFALH